MSPSCHVNLIEGKELSFEGPKIKRKEEKGQEKSMFDLAFSPFFLHIYEVRISLLTPACIDEDTFS